MPKKSPKESSASADPAPGSRAPRAEDELLSRLEEQLRLQTVVASIAADLLRAHGREAGLGISRALQALGEVAGVDRCRFFRLSPDLTRMENTHEWCAPGVEPALQRLKAVSLDAYPWLARKIRAREVLKVDAPLELPPEAAAERSAMERAGVRATLNVPVVSGPEVVGLLGFELVRGEKAWSEESFSLLQVVGNLIAAALERQEVEAELRRAKELAELATRAHAEFLALSSHELRTPLNAILGYTELILDEVEGPVAEEQRKSLQRIERNGRTLLKMIDGILDLSRMRAGDLEVQRVAFEVKRAVEEAVQPFARRAAEKGLALSWQVAEDLPRVTGDPARLQQVLTALLDNAVKFTPRGMVSVQAEPLPGSRSKPCLLFTVRDTGPGISREKQASIFRPFVQASPADTREHGGIGLGLALASALVENLGGRIWVESQPGAGSAFRFSLCFEDSLPG